MNHGRAWHIAGGGSSFGGRVLLTVGTNVLLAVLGLVTGVLAARLLGPQGRGELAAIQTWPSVIAGLAMLGLPDALVYFSAREPDQAGRYLSSAMLLALLSSVPFMALGYLVMPALLSAQHPKDIAAARWYLLLAPVFALVAMPYHPLRGRNDLGVWNALRILPSLGWLLVLTSAWLLVRPEPVVLAAGYLIVLGLSFFPVICTVARRVPGPFWPNLSKWRVMLGYGLPSMLSNTPQMLNLRLDQLLMAVFLPPTALGLYVIAGAWSSAVSPLFAAVGAVLFPQVASQACGEDRFTALAQGGRVGILVSLVMGLGLSLLAPVGIPFLFGGRFAAAIPVAVLLVFAAAVGGLNIILEEGLRGLGDPTTVMWAEFAGLAVTTILLVLLLSPLGIIGAALASLLGQSVIIASLLSQARRATGQSLAALLCPRVSEIRLGWQQVKAFMAALEIR